MLDAAQKARVVFEPIIEPVTLGPEADHHPGRLSIAGDDDLLAVGFAQKPREIVLDLGIAEPAPGSAGRSSTGASLKERARAICDQVIGQEMWVKRVSLADAKAHLSRLVEEAAAGEPVCITRRGKAVAQIIAVDTPRKRIDVAALRAMTDAMPMQPETARDFIRRMRDEDRY